jgi:fatty acid desaturase
MKIWRLKWYIRGEDSGDLASFSSQSITSTTTPWLQLIRLDIHTYIYIYLFTMSSSLNWIAYTYYPSMGAAVLFIVLFAIATILHTFHLFRTRTWFFIPLVIGGYSTYLNHTLSYS